MAADGELTRIERVRAARAWTLVAIPLLALPLALPFPVAVFGDTAETAPTIFGLVCVVAILAVQDRAYLRLSRADRHRIWRIDRSGEPSGDRRLDQLALARLDRVTARPTSKRGALLEIALLAAPAVAAGLRDSRWWLLCLVALPGMAVLLLLDLRGRARPHRDRLATALGADEPPPWWRYRPRSGSVTS
jgi:hypothetical protein